MQAICSLEAKTYESGILLSLSLSDAPLVSQVVVTVTDLSKAIFVFDYLQNTSGFTGKTYNNTLTFKLPQQAKAIAEVLAELAEDCHPLVDRLTSIRGSLVYVESFL